jgi:hypothetical protein
MSQAGLSCASNICLAVRRPPEPELAVSGGVHEFAGIRELPATCFFDVGPVGRGRTRKRGTVRAAISPDTPIPPPAKSRCDRNFVFEFVWRSLPMNEDVESGRLLVAVHRILTIICTLMLIPIMPVCK